MALEGLIDDTYCECTDLYVSRVLLTAPTEDLALYESLYLVGVGIATYAPIQGSLEGSAPPSSTPDGRPGVIIHFSLPRKYGLKRFVKALEERLNISPHMPFSSIYNALPRDREVFRASVGDVVRLWGDGFEEGVDVNGRSIYRVPVMTGTFVIERDFGVGLGVDGALEVMVRDEGVAIKAMKAAGSAVFNRVRYASVFNYPVGGLCGAKVGGLNYRGVRVTTNHVFCPTLRGRVSDSRVPEGSRAAFEFLVVGLGVEHVREALRRAVEALAGVSGVVKISAPQYSGQWGSLKIGLRELVRGLEARAK